MSKVSATKEKTRPSTRPALCEADQKDHQRLERRLRQFRARHRPYVAAIIAAGVFGSDEAWTGVLAALAETDAAESLAALNGLFDRLEKASPDSTRIAFPIADDPKHTDCAADVLTTHASRWGDAGFLLGLAVGMQLGPHALDGGVR